MNLRRIVTDKHSIDIQKIEDEEAVIITDLETEQKLVIEADVFSDLMELAYRLLSPNVKTF